MSSNQLPEVIVGFAAPPHLRRISKLSRKYCRDKHQLWQESMPVIPVNPNHPAASAACKWTPSAAVRESPPQATKARTNNALMHGASDSHPPWCHDVVSVAVASVTTDAGNTTSLASALAVSTATLVAAAAGSLTSPACSVNSSNDSSGSKDSDRNGGVDSPPGSPSGNNYEFSEFPVDGDDADDDNMPTDAEASKFTFLEHLEHYMERAQISIYNCKAVELVIMVEAGTTIREMDLMKEEVKEKVFLNSYVSIILEIPDEHFEHEVIGPAMLLAYKGARKKLLDGGTL